MCYLSQVVLQQVKLSNPRILWHCPKIQWVSNETIYMSLSFHFIRSLKAGIIAWVCVGWMYDKIHGKEGKFTDRRSLENRFPMSLCLNSLNLFAIFP